MAPGRSGSPISSAKCRQRRDQADHDLEFDHFARGCEFDEVDARDLPHADIGGTLQPGGVAAGDERPRLHEWRARHNMFAVAGGDKTTPAVEGAAGAPVREFHPSVFPGHTDRYTMKDEKEKYEGQSGKPAGDLRRERLKQALRENLKRRKSQARGRDDFPAAPSSPDDAPPRGRREKTPGK